MKNSEIEADLETCRKLKDASVGRSVYTPVVLSYYLEITDPGGGGGGGGGGTRI